MYNLKFILIIQILFQQYLFSIDFKKIKEHVDRTPKSKAKTTELLSNYLTEPFKLEDEKFAAIYFWIAKNINYDISKRNLNRTYLYSSELVEEVMKNRKGVCQHYAELFNELSRLSGLESYVVSGYGKEFGEVMNLPHAWNAIKINEKWYFIDVTWGAGYLYQGKYKKDFQLKYFMVEPNKFIEDHIAFDPMWQLMDFPIKYDEFDFGTINNKSSKVFYYNDTIKDYFKQSEIEQAKCVIRRMESNGRRNKLVVAELKYKKEYLNIALKNIEIENLNNGNYYYNMAVKQLNEFYDYKKKVKTKSKLLAKLDVVEKNLEISKKHFSKVQTTDRDIQKKLKGVNLNVKKFEKIIKQQKEYLE